MSNPTSLVQKLWIYPLSHDRGGSGCIPMRRDDEGFCTGHAVRWLRPAGDYVEQLTYLLFLKMADEQSRPPFNKPSPIPNGLDWPALPAYSGRLERSGARG
jgi:hypothetical protein